MCVSVGVVYNTSVNHEPDDQLPAQLTDHHWQCWWREMRRLSGPRVLLKLHLAHALPLVVALHVGLLAPGARRSTSSLYCSELFTIRGRAPCDRDVTQPAARVICVHELWHSCWYPSVDGVTHDDAILWSSPSPPPRVVQGQSPYGSGPIIPWCTTHYPIMARQKRAVQGPSLYGAVPIIRSDIFQLLDHHTVRKKRTITEIREHKWVELGQESRPVYMYLKRVSPRETAVSGSRDYWISEYPIVLWCQYHGILVLE